MRCRGYGLIEDFGDSPNEYGLTILPSWSRANVGIDALALFVIVVVPVGVGLAAKDLWEREDAVWSHFIVRVEFAASFPIVNWRAVKADKERGDNDAV